MRDLLLLTLGLGVVITAPFAPAWAQIAGATVYLGGVLWHWRRK